MECDVSGFFFSFFFFFGLVLFVVDCGKGRTWGGTNLKIRCNVYRRARRR